jgi:hypothetical protein
MKVKILYFLAIPLFLLFSCNQQTPKSEMKRIIFLHHSTGLAIWHGDVNRYIRKLTGRSNVRTYFKRYNRKNKTDYNISELHFPKTVRTNNPYDYYKIWIKKSGESSVNGDPSLEMLTKDFDVIIFKHCYPVSKIAEDTGNADIDSEVPRLENYKLQYEALKKKMHEFSSAKFIIWTPPVIVKNNLTPEEALRTRKFHDWLINEWDEKNDNIYLWDFYQYETEGGLYLKDEYSASPYDSHPNKTFAGRIAPKFAQFIIDVVENKVR